MSTDDEKPTTAERYSRAVNSSQLRLRDSRCDVDYLIAAGWLDGGLGTMLHRLRAEFDAVRADLRAAETFGSEWGQLIRAAEQAVREAGSPVPSAVQSEPDRLRLEGKRALLAERGLVLIQLKSLAPARAALGRFAEILATRIMFMRDDATVALLTGRALDAWLDPICHGCDGRGFNGARHRGEPKTTCRACRGTGMRSDSVGRTPEERQFVSALLVEIDQKLARTDRELRRLLAKQDGDGAAMASPASANSVRELKRRLVELRSVRAETD